MSLADPPRSSISFADRIKAARQRLKGDVNGTLSSSAFGNGCKLIRDHDTVCKTGTAVFAEEANALKVANELGLPVPKVHDVSKDDNGVCSIRMDWIDGECLEDIWPNMSAEDKVAVARQLGHILDVMRAASPPHPQRVYNVYTGGPFESELEFNDFLLDLAKSTPQAIKAILTETLQTPGRHRIVLSHADLSPRNIIVRDGKIQALVDWEYAGWYPEYWEYIKFFNVPSGCNGWKDLASYIFTEQYPSELLSYQAIARWQRP